MKRRTQEGRILLRLSLCLAGLLLCACAPLSPAPGVQVEAARDAVITAERRGSALVLDITSETGIGSAAITLPEEPQVRDLVLRLRLRGLEQLEFAYNAAAVRVSVASTGEPLVRAEAQRAGAESWEAISAGSPYWMDVGILGEGGEPSIPLQDGYFDVRAPADFVRGGHRSFTLSWVDFFR